MTLKEAIGVNVDIDLKTGKFLTHQEIFRRIIEFLGGVDEVAPYIPFTLDELKKSYSEDSSFNTPTTPMYKWNIASGFICWDGDCRPIRGELWTLYKEHGITTASNADGVCILKEAARQLILKGAK